MTKTKTRILVIPSWYPPDGGYFFREHSEALKQAGWDVDVLVNRTVGVRKLLALGPRAFRRRRFEEENGLRVLRGSYLKMPGSEAYNIHSWARSTRRLYLHYVRHCGAPDLILCHSATWAGYAASRISSCPCVIVEHRSFFTWRTAEARAMVKPYYRRPLLEAYSACSRIVVVSNSLLPGLKTLMPGIEAKCFAIPNMIREDMFLPPAEPRKAEAFVFLWAGRLEPVKGLDVLIEALRILKDRSVAGFTVRLAGKGSLRPVLEEQVRAAGLEQEVHFLGRLSRAGMQAEMQGANAFVLPTRYEAFGAVLIEAMATGLPVIASRSGGPEHIVDRECGLLVDAEDATQLADAMQTMLLNYESYDASRIRHQTMERYGQRRVMEAYGKLFNTVLAE